MSDVVLWEDTFEAGNALTVDYTSISNAETAAGIGVAASRGARGTGTGLQKYSAEFRKVVAPPALERTFFMEGDFDFSEAASSSGGHYIMELRSPSFGGAYFISVYADVNTNGLRVSLHNDVDFPDPEYDTANDVYVPSTFIKIRIEGTLSTVDGVTFESNTDGEFRLYSAAPGAIVGDFDHGAATLLLSQTGVHVMTDVNDPEWDRGIWGPMGNLDHVRIGYMDEVVTLPTGLVGSTVFGVNTTVTATRAFAVGLDGNSNVHSDSGVFKIFGDLEVTGSFTGGSVDINAELDGLGT